MAEDLNFVDLVSLMRIQPDTIVEKFGGLINSSFFDASNILGSLMQKGMINFTNSSVGQNAITITDLGKQTIKECEERAKSDFDALDFAIITQLSGGKRGLTDLGSSVNVRQRDLALHLYKLSEQQYVSYDMRNGSIDISLTEKGFLQVKSGMPKPQQAQVQEVQQQPQAAQESVAQPAQAHAEAQQAQMQAAQPQAEGAGAASAQEPSTDMKELEERMLRAKKRSTYMVIGVAAVIIIFVLALILIEMKVI